MAYNKPADLDGFISQMGKTDMRIRTQLAEDLVLYLSDPDNSIECTDLGLLIDGLMPWMSGSHFKIAQRSLEAFTEIIQRLGHDFNAYTSTVLPHVVDRLGDNRDTVREKAQLLLHKLMEVRVLAPQQLLDKLFNCFKHKNAKVREEFLQTIVNTLNEYGTQSLSVKTYIPPITVLLGDPTATVRDAAIQTLVEIYKHVGERLRSDLKKRDVPASKMAVLDAKFDEARSDGLLLPSATTAAVSDEVDTAVMARPTRLVRRTPSAPARKPIFDTPASGDLAAGAVSWEIFEQSFEVVPHLSIYNQRDMDDHLKTINTLISDKYMDWEKRVDALKKIRSLLIINVQNSPNFTQQLKDLSIAFLDILKELRSQVIREACISLAYMSKVLKNKLDAFCVYISQELINLIQNSAKVISSSGLIAFKYVIKYTHAPKLLPIITQSLIQSKSKDIRSSLCEILMLLFDEWQTKSMEKFSLNLRDALKKSIADADSDARKYSRKAFWGFRRHFVELADNLYATLDPAAQRALDKEKDGAAINGTNSMSASLRGSNSSLNSMSGAVLKRRQSSGLRSPASIPPAVQSTSVSTENLSTTRLQRAPSLPRSYNKNRSGIPIAHREPPLRAGFRSVSAVDTAAAQRARARLQYSNLARTKITSGTASLQGQYAQQARQKKVPVPSQQPERQVVRSRAGVSQSQPTSRSTSPSSRLRENYSNYTSAYRPTGTVPKTHTGIPRSLANSRETSPNRATHYGSLRKNIYNTNSQRRQERPPLNPGRFVMAQKILQQSREAENALADALSPDEQDMSADFSRLSLSRKQREESDESEASSVCSERSFDSYRRGNDSYSWNGSRTRLDSSRPIIEDIDTIIQYCASTHWSERKDGLISLTQYLSEGKLLSIQQLQCVLDLFRKMFMDPHIKVYALFLDTVNELILAHSNDLYDWLFILLTRLFNKLGTDLLGSMYGKIWKTLQLIHEYFPGDLQLQCVFKILVDAAQTPNLKTKQATLKFLTSLAANYCRAEYLGTQPPVDRAVLKIIQMASDQKSVELRSQARLCLFALYNCNTPNMTMILTELPKQFQDSAKTIIQQNMRKSTSGTNSPSSPLSCASPKPVLSPQQTGPYSFQNHNNFKILAPRSRQTSVESAITATTVTTTDSEEIYKNLRKTTAEIQNYSFESKLDRDTNSKDSGISQMGNDQLIHHEILFTQSNGVNGHFISSSMDKDDSCNGSKTQSATTTESNTPENTVRLDPLDGSQKLNTSSKCNFTKASNGEIITEKGQKESDIIKATIALNIDSTQDAVCQALCNLCICIKYGNCELPKKHFKEIMQPILKFLESPNNIIMIAALDTLGKIIRSDEMKTCWINFLELILLKIIDCYRVSKEVAREIDIIITKIAIILPLDKSVYLLNPIIATGDFPLNLCALKILTEMTEKQGKDLTEAHLDTIMPNVARLADDHQSMVRKAAVFCIVKLYIHMGEEKVKPKFTLLNSSKIRLLNVYIGKAQGNSKTSS